MGTTTRYHPISLHVIRGGAAYCGYSLGRIRQFALSPDRKTASYTTTIESYPADLKNPSLLDHKVTLNACFVADINVTKVWQTYGNKIYVELSVCVESSFEEQLEHNHEVAEGEIAEGER